MSDHHEPGHSSSFGTPGPHPPPASHATTESQTTEHHSAREVHTGEHTPRELARLAARQEREAHSLYLHRSPGPRAFWVALVGHVLLGLRSVRHWGSGLWLLLALVAIPALAGWLGGRNAGRDVTPNQRFWDTAPRVGLVMAGRTGFGLIIAHGGFSSGGRGSAVLVVWLFLTVLYTVVAGAVAGMAASMTAPHHHRGESDEHPS